MTRGRVVTVDGDVTIVRTERENVGVVRAENRDGPAPNPGFQPGDLVDGDTLVRRYDGPPYPDRSTEIARLPHARIEKVYARAKALAAVRTFFASRGFLEVETPLLVPSPGLEIHLDAVEAGGGFLITSPEYQMKRLLAAGLERIYQVCKCFRGNEHGPHHASEFTMIEWYRAYDELASIIDDTEQLVYEVVIAVSGAPFARVLSGASSEALSSSGAWRRIDVTPPWPRMTVREAMARFAGVEVDGDEPAAALAAKVRAAGILIGGRVDGGGIDGVEGAGSVAWDDAFFAAFLARVEPAIAAMDRPLILHDWPAPLAALAKRRDDDPRVALRFEAYVGGLELANAFGELTDPIEQRARFLEDQRVRRERGSAVYPLDEKLLAALVEGLPPSAGIALGFDRLVMLATGASHIDEVLTFSAAEL
ncbi:MAG: EF-P lysine aminoacylase EpmA [Kofleriaceae bacterium]